MICPYNDCDGRLVKGLTITTLMECHPLDMNTITETFECTRCRCEVTRSWAWKVDKEPSTDIP